MSGALNLLMQRREWELPAGDRTLDVLTRGWTGAGGWVGCVAKAANSPVPPHTTRVHVQATLLGIQPEPGASRSLIPPVPLGLKLATAAFRTKVPLPAHTAPGASAPPGGGARMEAVRSGGAGLPGSCLRREAQWVGTSDRNLGSPGQPEVLCPSLQLLF